MDPFRIKRFQSIDKAKQSEQTLKKMGLSVVLTGSHDLYVSVEHIDIAIEALGLPPDAASTIQTGPWCPRCGQQLVSRRNSTRLFSFSESWYCYKCCDQIKTAPAIERFSRPLKRALVKMGYYSKPSFLIIGAEKSGTSAMFEILQQHPQIVAPREKEPRFFDDYIKITYGDFDSYHEMFPLPHQLMPGKLTFEASPSYLFNSACAKRIYKYDSHMRLIVILRDPVSRAFSAWKMNKMFAQSSNPYFRSLGDKRSFEQAINEEAGMLETAAWEKQLFSYVARGIYVNQLENYLQYFPRESLLILEQSCLLRDPQAAFTEVFRFLQIEEQFVIKPMRVNVSTSDDEMSNQTRDMLGLIYKPYNEKLFKLIEREYDW